MNSFLASMYAVMPVLADGLRGLQESAITNWVGPAFIILVAIAALVFVKNREFRGLIAFVAIAIIVGLLIFFGSDLFGKEGGLTKAAKGLVDQVNYIFPLR